MKTKRDKSERRRGAASAKDGRQNSQPAHAPASLSEPEASERSGSNPLSTRWDLVGGGPLAVLFGLAPLPNAAPAQRRRAPGNRTEGSKRR